MDTAVKPPPNAVVRLGELLRAGRARGQPLPVAFVVSVFDDILSTGPDADVVDRVSPDDVAIDPHGVARLLCGAQVDALTPILVEALGSEDQVPPSARALLDRLISGDPSERPADAEQLRQWLRQSLGTPAPRDEVSALVETWVLTARPLKTRSASGRANRPSERNRRPSSPRPALVEFPVIHGHRENRTLLDFPEPPFPQKAPESEEPEADDTPAEMLMDPGISPRRTEPEADDTPAEMLTDPGISPRHAEPEADDTPAEMLTDPGISPRHAEPEARDTLADTLMAPGILPRHAEPEVRDTLADTLMAPGISPRATPSGSGSGSGSGKRPVVRHRAPRGRPISVVAAPAARRSARPRRAHGDAIVVSADENRGWFWVVVIAVGIAAMYYLFLS